MNDEYLSITQAAAVLGVNRKTVWRWVQKEKIESETIGGRVFIRESVVTARNPSNRKV